MRGKPVLLVAIAVAASPVSAGETVDVHAFSDAVHRGASLTDGNPGLGFSASWDFESGWFLGGGGYYADGDPSGLNLSRSFNVNAGWFRTLGGASAVELSLKRVEFVDVVDWNYTELRADYHFTPEFGVMLAWAPDYYGQADTVNAAGTWRPRLSDNTYGLVAAGVGYVSDGLDETIGWGQIGAGLNVGSFDMTLSWNVIDNSTREIFFRPGNTLAFQISYRLR